MARDHLQRLPLPQHFSVVETQNDVGHQGNAIAGEPLEDRLVLGDAGIEMVDLPNRLLSPDDVQHCAIKVYFARQAGA